MQVRDLKEINDHHGKNDQNELILLNMQELKDV